MALGRLWLNDERQADACSANVEVTPTIETYPKSQLWHKISCAFFYPQAFRVSPGANQNCRAINEGNGCHVACGPRYRGPLGIIHQIDHRAKGFAQLNLTTSCVHVWTSTEVRPEFQAEPGSSNGGQGNEDCITQNFTEASQHTSSKVRGHVS